MSVLKTQLLVTFLGSSVKYSMICLWKVMYLLWGQVEEIN